MNISYKDLREISNTIDSICEKIKGNFDNIENCGNKLLNNSYWNGSSADYFQIELNNLKENFVEVNSELKQMVQYLRSVCMSYENVDQRVVNAFKGLF